jgi:hypothetical protein
MNPFQTSLRSVIALGAGLAIVFLVPWRHTNADDEAKVRAENDVVAKQRLAVMQERVSAFRVASEDESIPNHLEERPIYRYSDPARRIFSSAIWRLGANGRPRALICTELRPFQGSPRIVYEFLSLTETPFSATSEDYVWQPNSSAATMKPLPRAPVPAATATARLLQMKQQSQRFTASELVGREECELRLMPSPIERYTPGGADGAATADGALFLLSYGTNPEVVLLIESDGKAWSYGIARLTGAERVTAKLDDETVWDTEPSVTGPNRSYSAATAPIVIPGTDP